MKKTAFIVHILASLLVMAGLIWKPLPAAAEGVRPEAGWSGTRQMVRDRLLPAEPAAGRIHSRA
jgi:hypothetical protein